MGCKDGTAPSSQDSQTCTSLKSFKHHITFLNDVEKVNSISYTMRTVTLSIVKRLTVFYDPLASVAIVPTPGYAPG